MLSLVPCVVPPAAAFAARAHGTSRPNTIRISYVFGVELRTAAGPNLIEEAAARFSTSKEVLTAETTAESVATGTADAIIALQSQDPSTFVPANYSALMAMVAEKSAADGTQVYGGHCETATLCRLLSVSLTCGAWPRQMRATA